MNLVSNQPGAAMGASTFAVGMALPPFHLQVTTKHIVMGAVASRDWQPQHHDSAWATRDAGLRNIIMNNYTQAGWISRYITDWSGPAGRIGRLRFAMKGPICPGDEVAFAGVINAIEPGADAMFWLQIGVELKAGDRVVTDAGVRLAMPAHAAAPSVWQCAPDAWRP